MFLKRLLILVFTFLIFVSILNSQDKDDVNIKNKIQYADSLYGMKIYDRALESYYIIEQNLRGKKDWNKWFHIINKIRSCNQLQNKYIETKNDLNKFIKYAPENEKSIKGKLKFLQGFNEIKVLNFLGGIDYYKSALEYFNQTKSDRSLVQACYNNLSINYSRIGDQRSAIDFTDKAIDYCKANGMEVHLCDLYSNKGQYYFYDGQYAVALEQYYSAFDVCESSDECSFIYVSIAELLLQKGDVQSAKEQLANAYDINNQESQYYSIILNRYLFESGDIESAKKMIPNTLKLIERNSDTRNLIKETTKFAQFLYDNQEEEMAVKYAHRAISLFYTDLDSLNIYERPDISGEIPYTYVIESLRIKARYFKDLYQISKEKNHLEEAYFYYHNLLLFFDLLKGNYYSTSSKYRLGRIIQDHYAEAIAFFIELFQKELNRTTLERAFNLAQRANSFVLRNAISDRKALQLANVSQDSLEKYLQYVWDTGEDSMQDSTMKASTLIEFDNYKMSLKENYPSYRKYEEKEEVSIDAIQSLLLPNSLLVKYYYHDGLLSVFGITSDTVFAENISFAEREINLINGINRIVTNGMHNDSLINVYLSKSKFLFEYVLGDFIEQYNLLDVDHFLIVPDGPLKRVSFSALAIKDTQNWNDPSTYLIGTYSINYLYYCSQLSSSSKNRAPKGEFIGFGIEYNDEFLDEITKDYLSNFKTQNNLSRSLSLSPLEYADDEAVFLAEVFGGQSFINSDVTRNRVMSAINKFDVVHISAHAFVDNNDYLNSYVVLNKNEKDQFRLGYADILGLDLNNELVVLSACQTSNGEDVIGEGLMSLSRAFVQSGSKSTVGAYWNAPDYATKELMTQFYLNLEKGYSKSKAMQQAQIEFLTNDNISSPAIRAPFFWGSWAVYGNDKPIDLTQPIFNSNAMFYLVLILLVGILLGVMFHTRKPVKDS